MSAKVVSRDQNTFLPKRETEKSIYSNQLKEWVFPFSFRCWQEAKPPLPATFDSSGVDLSLTEFHQPWCWVLLIWRTLRSLLGNLDPTSTPGSKVDLCGFFVFGKWVGTPKISGIGSPRLGEIVWRHSTRFFIKKKKCKAYELARNQIRTMGSQKNRS